MADEKAKQKHYQEIEDGKKYRVRLLEIDDYGTNTQVWEGDATFGVEQIPEDPHHWNGPRPAGHVTLEINTHGGFPNVDGYTFDSHENWNGDGGLQVDEYVLEIIPGAVQGGDLTDDELADLMASLGTTDIPGLTAPDPNAGVGGLSPDELEKLFGAGASAGAVPSPAPQQGQPQVTPLNAAAAAQAAQQGAQAAAGPAQTLQSALGMVAPQPAAPPPNVTLDMDDKHPQANAEKLLSVLDPNGIAPAHLRDKMKGRLMRDASVRRFAAELINANLVSGGGGGSFEMSGDEAAKHLMETAATLVNDGHLTGEPADKLKLSLQMAGYIEIGGKLINPDADE